MLRRFALIALTACALFAFAPVHGQDRPQAQPITLTRVAQTYQRQDGNRLVAGAGTFPNVQRREYVLDLTRDVAGGRCPWRWRIVVRGVGGWARRECGQW